VKCAGERTSEDWISVTANEARLPQRQSVGMQNKLYDYPNAIRCGACNGWMQDFLCWLQRAMILDSEIQARRRKRRKWPVMNCASDNDILLNMVYKKLRGCVSSKWQRKTQRYRPSKLRSRGFTARAPRFDLRFRPSPFTVICVEAGRKVALVLFAGSCVTAVWHEIEITTQRRLVHPSFIVRISTEALVWWHPMQV
jgi:hypothetical protein